jgi:hypothetical protein
MGLRRLWLLLLAPLLIQAGVVMASPRQPGHRRMIALRPFAVVLPRGTLLESLRPVPTPEYRPYSFLETRALRISLGMVLFDPDLTTVTPILGAGPLPPPRGRMNLVPPALTEDVIQQERERDQIYLASRPTSTAALGLSVLVFTGISILASQPPLPLRRLFNGPVQIGPATFEYGGLGIGLRARSALCGG